MEFNPILMALSFLFFAGLVVVLKFLYIDPVLALLKKRDQLTVGQKKSANELEQKLEEISEKYHSAITKTKRDLEAVRSEQLERVRKESEARLKQTERELGQKIKEHDRELARELEAVSEKIPDLASSISQEIKRALIETRVVRSS
ncbi:MAG: hypothetical protein EA369_05220 [Bradymonadales bacterium]|nr:MAG: hypothetical protein EA369_05220 [Bradymonadales bacterium]